MNFLVLGLSHHTAPVGLREKFAYAETAVLPALARLREAGLATEGVIVSTCNRTELYVSTTRPANEAAPALRKFLRTDRAVADPIGTELYVHHQQAALEHLFRVAAGLDSLVLGETEILGQLKKSYEVALQGGHTGRVLNKAFQSAFSVAKKIRSETSIQRGNTSVASVAVELADSIFDGLANRDVMVIGAGDTSEKTARALLSRGARSLFVSNRSFDRAATLAAELGGQAIHFDEWEREFGRIDIVISSTSAPHYVLDRPRLERLLKHRARRSLLLIDIAVPRDIDPDVKQLDGVFLANVDDLQAIADEHVRARRDEIVRCDAIVRERARQFLAGFAGASDAPARKLAYDPR
jgi:glutamyl-tRNA reductase